MTESPKCYVRWKDRRPIVIERAREVWSDLLAGPVHDEGCLCPSCMSKLHRAQGGRFSRETFFYSWLELEAKLSLVDQQDYTVFRPRPLADEERTSIEWADMFSWIRRCPASRSSKCSDRHDCIHACFTEKKKPAPSECEGALERRRPGPRSRKRKRAPSTIHVVAAFLKENFPALDANPAHIQMNLWHYRKSGVEAELVDELKSRRMKRDSVRAGGDDRWQTVRLAQRVADFVYAQPERTIAQRDLQRRIQRPIRVIEDLRPWLLLNYGITVERGKRKGQAVYRGRLKDSSGRILHVGLPE